MLNIKKSTTLTGRCIVDGVEIEGYTAVINSEDPADIKLSSFQIKQELCKENRIQCRADRAEFEDTAYLEQDKMIAEAAR